MKSQRHWLRGDSPQLNSPVLERRSWPREPVQSPVATLSWTSPLATTSVDAHVVNLSRGGAGLLVRESPPPDAMLHLVLAGGGGVVIEGWVVATRRHPEHGWMFLHMKFSQTCPERFLDLVLDDSPDL